MAQALVDAYVATPESVLATDTGTAFKGVGKQFQLHLQVNHSDTLVGLNGEHVNNSEGFSARQDRSEKGIYLNIEAKYLRHYVTETAFREDHRRLPRVRQPTGRCTLRSTLGALSTGPASRTVITVTSRFSSRRTGRRHRAGRRRGGLRSRA